MNYILLIGAAWLAAWLAAWVFRFLFGSSPPPPAPVQERMEDLHGKELDRLAEENRFKKWQIKYSAYLRSPEWQSVRQEILNNANYCCRDCGETATEVHHLKYTSEQLAGVFKAENYANLVALCGDCHGKRHGKIRDKSPWKQEVLPLGIRV